MRALRRSSSGKPRVGLEASILERNESGVRKQTRALNLCGTESHDYPCFQTPSEFIHITIREFRPYKHFLPLVKNHIDGLHPALLRQKASILRIPGTVLRKAGSRPIAKSDRYSTPAPAPAHPRANVTSKPVQFMLKYLLTVVCRQISGI